MSMPQGYDYEFVDKLPDDCICKICLLVLRQPVQIRGCGHRFCKDCLYEATKSKEVCPVDLRTINIQKDWWPWNPGEDVFDDIAVERTIKSLHIKCPSKSEECQWQGELRDVKDHITVCEEVEVSCPNECGKEMIRSEVEKHVSNNCPMTIIPCMYQSSGCTFKTERKNMDHHLEENSKEHRALVKEENRSVADGLSSKISLMHVIIMIIISLLVFMHYQLSSLKEKEKFMKMQDENQKLREEFIKMQGQVFSHTKFIWRIKKISELLKKPTPSYIFNRPYANDPLLSESFYTKKYGYRMRVFLYPDGKRNEDNGHLSIYVQVLQGEYDAVLPWPFKTNLTISLLDKTGYNLQMRKTLESHFSRLRSVPQGEGNGFQQFVSHKMLKDRNYIVEDSIYVQVEIEE